MTIRVGGPLADGLDDEAVSEVGSTTVVMASPPVRARAKGRGDDHLSSWPTLVLCLSRWSACAPGRAAERLRSAGCDRGDAYPDGCALVRAPRLVFRPALRSRPQ